MQQLGVGATLDAHGHSIKQVTMSIDPKFLGLQAELGVKNHRAAPNLVCDDVQLYDTSRSGSRLLADNVEHFAHQFLNRDTYEKWQPIHLVYCI